MDIMLINTSAGIMMISVASPMAQTIGGLSAAAAAVMVGLMGIFNGAGRIGWAAASDYLSRPVVFIIFFRDTTRCFPHAAQYLECAGVSGAYIPGDKLLWRRLFKSSCIYSRSIRN